MGVEGMTDDQVPIITPPGSSEGATPPPMAGCPFIDEIEEQHREARTVAWVGVAVAIFGVLSWSAYGFLVCGAGAIICGLYARRYASMEAVADFVAGAMLLAILGLRAGGVL